MYKRTDTAADVFDTAVVTKVWKQFIFSKYAMPYAIERYYMDIEHKAKCFVDKGYYGYHINYESNQQGILSVNYGGGYFGGRNFFWWPIEFSMLATQLCLTRIPLPLFQELTRIVCILRNLMESFGYPNTMV